MTVRTASIQKSEQQQQQPSVQLLLLALYDWPDIVHIDASNDRRVGRIWQRRVLPFARWEQAPTVRLHGGCWRWPATCGKMCAAWHSFLCVTTTPGLGNTRYITCSRRPPTHGPQLVCTAPCSTELRASQQTIDRLHTRLTSRVILYVIHCAGTSLTCNHSVTSHHAAI